ncbi:MAG TPA: hypothetical protein VEY10_15530 [Flavisolibacter sp.]|nr:hypothetical protein [Flavisolibacter sp.]
MAIELSTITFTEQDDIVPASGVEEIFNTGITNTLGGNDIITGENTYFIPEGSIPVNSGIRTYGGILDTGNGNDTITGIYGELKGDSGAGFGIYIRESTVDTGDGDDIITGTSISFGQGIQSYISIIKTGDGNDIITGIVQGGDGDGIRSADTTIDTGKGNDIINGTARWGISFEFDSIVTTGDGNDTITGTSIGNMVNPGVGLSNLEFMDTGDDDDIITGTSAYGYGISNQGNMATGNGNDTITGIGDLNYSGLHNSIFGSIDTQDGNDSIISKGKFYNYGNVFLGDGNDSIATDTGFPNLALENFRFIGTGDGNDIITSTGFIYNEGVIETGKGDDSIIVDGGTEDITGTTYGIKNKGGAINMGDGNDSIIANEGFESAPNSSGAWFLGEGEDYIKGYGSGDFYGGSGNDTLELTPGTYTVGIWDRVVLAKGNSNSLMLASEFEQLIAGGQTYDFSSLTAGQIIVVA